jgi:hypothetical protein
MLRKGSLGLIVALAACGSARLIHRDVGGGVIELQGDRATAMDQANSEMASHCGPNNYTIVEEGDEVVGTTYVQNSRNGRRASSGSTATAWRVHYQCNGAAGGPQPMPAAAPQDPNAPPPPPPGAYY